MSYMEAHTEMPLESYHLTLIYALFPGLKGFYICKKGKRLSVPRRWVQIAKIAVEQELALAHLTNWEVTN